MTTTFSNGIVKTIAICFTFFVTASPLAAQAAYPACPGGVRFLFQVERPAAFLADSAMHLQPVAMPTNPRATIAQFVVDTTGRVIAESFHPIKFWGAPAVDQAKSALSTWRFAPAMIGGRPTCQLMQSALDSLRGRQ